MAEQMLAAEAARADAAELRFASGFRVWFRARTAPHEPHAFTRPQTLESRQDATLCAVCAYRGERRERAQSAPPS
eukprot:4200052-Prymnesium_polylepis.1